jgi:hypothetical protein
MLSRGQRCPFFAQRSEGSFALKLSQLAGTSLTRKLALEMLCVRTTVRGGCPQPYPAPIPWRAIGTNPLAGTFHPAIVDDPIGVAL